MHDQGLRVNDLGELDGDVLLFGGPYSNLQASEALLDVANTMAIPAQNRICTGDMVAYCANPVETLALWRGQCMLVAGNCERQLGADAVDCGCGFEAGSACDLLSRDWYPFASAALSGDDRAFLAAAPDIVVFSHMGKRYGVIHGGLRQVARYLWSTSAEGEFLSEISAIRQATGAVDCVVAGHCGMAFQANFDGIDWVNAGAIGMPPHDGDPATRYAVLSDDGIRIGRLSYDYRAAQTAMQRAGLVQGYEKSLTSGYWPSEDILPLSLRASG